MCHNQLYLLSATDSSPAGTYPIIVSGAVSGNYSISYVVGTLTVTNTIGAANREPMVSKAISPNGDGVNDVLIITGIEDFADNRLTLINSSGIKVFEIVGYDNTGKVFNGHSNINSERQRADTYFYQLQYSDNGVQKNRSGYFKILMRLPLLLR